MDTSNGLWEAEELLRRLVAIPSVNPDCRGAEVASELTKETIFGESRLTDFLESLLSEWGQSCGRQVVHRGRDNFLVRLESPHWTVSESFPGRKPLVVLSAHQDTVPPCPGMEDPWTPRREGDRLFGLGACDVKGGMTAMLLTAKWLLQQSEPPPVDLLLAFTVNEESGFTGARALADLFRQPDGRFLPKRPDAIVVAEPTQLQVVVAHKGVARWRIHTRGQSAHSATPEAGQNAIYRMARVILAIEAYQEELRSRPADPWCGTPSISVGIIRGGSSVNTVPESCTIEVDRRLIPGETSDFARIELRCYLEEKTGLLGFIEHEVPWMEGPPLVDQSRWPSTQRLSEIARRLAGAGQLTGAHYATDAAFFAELGIPTVVFGPGSIAQAHSANEWVSLEEVRLAAEILYEWIVNWEEKGSRTSE